MVLAKSKNSVGLGNSLMNDRFGKGKGQDMRRGPKGITRTAPDGSTYVTTPKQEAAWVKMQSVTEQAALDEFLNTAKLADTDFTAEKLNNVKIIHRDQKNPYLLSAAEERTTVKKQNANKKRLTVPRRPLWNETTTPQELDTAEKASLLDWRRGLAELQETSDLLMTPFERNLEVWRQLWRVIERSDLVVQIVDARNPLLFRCEDLEEYVKEVDKRKKNLLLVNKADMMTLEQRQLWADHFEHAGVNFKFFSAAMAKDANEGKDMDTISDESDENSVNRPELSSEDDDDIVHPTQIAEATKQMQLQDDDEEDEDDDDDDDDEEDDEEDDSEAGDEEDSQDDDDDDDDDEEEEGEEASDNREDERRATIQSSSRSKPFRNDAERTRILTTDELEALFLEHAPEIDTGQDGKQRKTSIGLVGYPNVGKSSTINALIGAKKVSVSATPGKTKHFQTIHLSDQVILCDCPGLVFPNFATTKAELVCNGILPIDQLREYTGPAALVAQRIPKAFLEALYGMKIRTRPLEEGGTGIPTGEEVLRAYARARGFATTGKGTPDESRAARYVFKDYVKGKLLFCHPPPMEPPVDGQYFNRALYDAQHLPQRRRAYMASGDGPSGTATSLLTNATNSLPGAKTQGLDKRFFAPGQRNAGHLTQPFQYQYSEQGLASGKQFSGRKLKAMVALEKNIEPADLKMNSKKHFKANKKKKTRTLGTEYT